jgi:hypothetical protein
MLCARTIILKIVYNQQLNAAEIKHSQNSVISGEIPHLKTFTAPFIQLGDGLYVFTPPPWRCIQQRPVLRPGVGFKSNHRGVNTRFYIDPPVAVLLSDLLRACIKLLIARPISPTAIENMSPIKHLFWS